MAEGTDFDSKDLNDVRETDKLLGGGGDDERVKLPPITKEEPKIKMRGFMTMKGKVFLLLLKVKRNIFRRRYISRRQHTNRAILHR